MSSRGTVYTVLNPRGYAEPLAKIPLAPRLSELAGKTVYIILGFPGVLFNPIPPHLSDALQETVPGVKVVYDPMPEEFESKAAKEAADAVITCLSH